jgi:hypothetical protein
MNLPCADSLMSIFGFRRVSINEAEQASEYECLLNGGALQDRVAPSSGKLIRSKTIKTDACPGELSLEDRWNE